MRASLAPFIVSITSLTVVTTFKKMPATSAASWVAAMGSILEYHVTELFYGNLVKEQ